MPSRAGAAVATLGTVRPGHVLSILVALASFAFPAAAMADDFQEIFGDYKDNGQINGCYRPDEIHNAGSNIPPDIQQYAPDQVTDAVLAAIDADLAKAAPAK